MPMLPKLSPLLVLTALLAGCGPDKNEFAPPCPRAIMVRGLEDIARYGSETSRDLSDLVVQGRLTAIGGSCKFLDRRAQTVEATVSARAEFLRGPAMRGRETTVQVFIAVTEGEAVLDKQIVQMAVYFPTNVDRIALDTPAIRMVLPTTPTKSPAAFGIVAGFQLTPAEVAANRQNPSR